MQGLEILDSFQPHGCDFVIEEHAVTAAGGTQMITLYEELDKVNRTIVGGGGKTVAVGGYITGGGHSALAPRYGLGADQVLEIEVVTPKGDVLIANECQNKDLFWAMRGVSKIIIYILGLWLTEMQGGGSTFGVATSITMITHPTPHLVSWLGAIVSTEIRAPWFYDLVGYVLTQLSYLDSEGISGYIIVATNTTDPYGQFPGRYSAISLLLLLQDTQDVTKIQSILQPIFDHVQEAWPSALVVPVLNASYSSFLEWYNIFYDHASAGDDFYVGSWLMNAEAFQDASALSSAWVPFSEVGGGGTAYLVAGAGVRNAQPRGGGNAVCPAWRKALVHASKSLHLCIGCGEYEADKCTREANGIDFPSHDPSARQQALIKLNAAVDPLRQLAPDMGAYINEVRIEIVPFFLLLYSYTCFIELETKQCA